MNRISHLRGRQAIVVGLMALIAALHIVGPGRYSQGELYRLYYSYFSDIAIPFAFYFLLCMAETSLPILKGWQVKAAVAFFLPSFAETCQYFGIPLLGSTFDPLDYLMYAIGVGAAALVEQWVFTPLIPFWAND
jgi:hypothetical protein